MGVGHRKPFSLITAGPLHVAVAILVANDLFLKHQYPGFLTGKLSDFFGIAAFYWCIRILLPCRPAFVQFAVVILFLFWKSPFSQGLIDGWRELTGIRYARVVDYSDLLALSVLPFTEMVMRFSKPLSVRRSVQIAGLGVCLIAFAATPAPRSPEIEAAARQERAKYNSYDLNGFELFVPLNPEEIMARLKKQGLKVSKKVAVDSPKGWFWTSYTITPDLSRKVPYSWRSEAERCFLEPRCKFHISSRVNFTMEEGAGGVIIKFYGVGFCDSLYGRSLEEVRALVKEVVIDLWLLGP